MVLRLWVPLIHSLSARNWNSAASGACLTASRVANSVAVSTPLRVASFVVVVVVVVVMSVSFLWLVRRRCRRGGVELWSRREAWRRGRGAAASAVASVSMASAELALELDERSRGRELGQRAGELEDVARASGRACVW